MPLSKKIILILVEIKILSLSNWSTTQQILKNVFSCKLLFKVFFFPYWWEAKMPIRLREPNKKLVLMEPDANKIAKI